MRATKTAVNLRLNKVQAAILECRYCRAHSRGLLVPGEGSDKAKIVFVGEAPGKTEAELGRPFVGRAGKLLEQMLESINLSREQVFITSALKYLPLNYVTPKPADIDHGREHLLKQIQAIKPKIVVLLGSYAAQSVLQEKLVMQKAHGTHTVKNKVAYFYCYHPAAPLHNPKLRIELAKDFQALQKLYAQI